MSRKYLSCVFSDSNMFSLPLALSIAPQGYSKLGSSGVIVGVTKMFEFLCHYLILCDLAALSLCEYGNLQGVNN